MLLCETLESAVSSKVKVGLFFYLHVQARIHRDEGATTSSNTECLCHDLTDYFVYRTRLRALFYESCNQLEKHRNFW